MNGLLAQKEQHKCTFTVSLLSYCGAQNKRSKAPCCSSRIVTYQHLLDVSITHHDRSIKHNLLLSTSERTRRDKIQSRRDFLKGKDGFVGNFLKLFVTLLEFSGKFTKTERNLSNLLERLMEIQENFEQNIGKLHKIDNLNQNI